MHLQECVDAAEAYLDATNQAQADKAHDLMGEACAYT
jgi:hypothetical protein